VRVRRSNMYSYGKFVPFGLGSIEHLDVARQRI
jgi:hypothetical protein